MKEQKRRNFLVANCVIQSLRNKKKGKESEETKDVIIYCEMTSFAFYVKALITELFSSFAREP
jgi:hypothetical protein